MTLQLAPHQHVAVARILELLHSRGGVLLADDVGLGKSWVAAAVASEFRNRGYRVEIMVPLAIVSQWRELLVEFAVDAEILTHDSLHGSFDFPGTGSRLLIVDEAHRFRNPDTNRYRALATRCAGSRVLLVTATPICNRLRDLQSLIGLISPDDALVANGVPSIHWAFENNAQQQLSAIIRELVVRRRRDVLPPSLQFGAIERRVITFTVSAFQAQIASTLHELRFPLIAASTHIPFLRQLLWRRLESSAAALLDSVRRQKRFYHRARESLARGIVLSKVDYRSIFGADEDQLLYQDLLFPDLWLTSGGSDDGTGAEIDREIERLSNIESLLRKTGDDKIATFRQLIAGMPDEQIVVFVGAVATGRELFRACSDSIRSGLLTSRLRWVNRMRKLTTDQVLALFGRGDARLLIMTDLGAEGLNLQFAGAVIHYDLPWNPVRIEQRNGRIHRIGQRRNSVTAFYFLPQRENDRTVMRRLTTKKRIRRVLEYASSDASPCNVAWFRPRITRTDPQALLTALIDSKRLLDDDTAELLTRRYRAGPELILRQMSGEFFDATRRDYLVSLLRREVELTSGFER